MSVAVRFPNPISKSWIAAGATCGALVVCGLCVAGTSPTVSARPLDPPTPAAAPTLRTRVLDLGAAGSLRSALLSLPVSADETDRALLALSEQLDIDDDRPPGRYEVTLQPAASGRSELAGIAFRGPHADVAAIRTPSGDFRVASGPLPEPRHAVVQPTVLRGSVEQLLYGLGPSQASAAARAQALKLIRRRLDLTRDVALGDTMTLVLGAPSGGASVGVLYAAIDHAGRLTQAYNCGSADADPIDGDGRPRIDGVLRQPVSLATVASAFGQRLHPILGYWRFHRGIDLRAAAGTPVSAAGDGRVAAAGWVGAYGRLVRLDHSAGWQTGYAHLSAWAPNLHTGDLVRQGQVIGYVGSSGLATAAHLHFEVYHHGVAVNPEHFQIQLGRSDTPVRLESERRCVGQILAEGRQ